jgi:hypothetical protein
MKVAEKYYNLQLEQRLPSSYWSFRPAKECSAYEMMTKRSHFGHNFGETHTYTRDIKILNTLTRDQKIAVTRHEEEHLRDTSLDEGTVRDKTGTHILN